MTVLSKIKPKIRIFLAVLIVAAVVIAGWLYNASRTADVASAAWFNDSWLYRARLSVDSSLIDDDISDFPVAIHLNSDRIDYNKTGSNGQDLRFTDSNGDLLDWELENWNSSGTSTIWVRLPGVDKYADTDFFMYYGNGSATSTASSTLVWDDDYVMVQHLEEDPTTTCSGSDEVCDSTRNNNDGNLAAGGPIQKVGILDGSLEFDSDSGDKISYGLSSLSSFSVSMWINASSTDSTAYENLLAATNANDGEISYTGIGANRGKINFWYSSADHYADTAMTEDIWHHVVIVSDAGSVTFYLDGSSDGTASSAPSVAWDFMGASNFSNEQYDGFIDEARVSNIVRSSAWVKADYNSGADSLLTYGTEETGKGPVGYWQFDEGFGTTAYNTGSATGTDGTISGSLWKDESFCYSGKCLDFDGTDDVVTVTQRMPINLTGKASTTLEAWFYPHSTGEADVGEIISKGSATYIRVDAGTGGLDVSASLDLATDATLTISNAVATSTWNHVALVYEDDGDDEISLYINGILRGVSSDGSGAIATDDNDLLIGGSTGANFDGLIDEVKIYAYNRSADEIKADYTARGSPKGTSAAFGIRDYSYLTNGLVGYWKMDESAANTCTGGTNDSCDSSGQDNDGAWTGNATATTTAKYSRGVEFDGTGDYVQVSDFDL